MKPYLILKPFKGSQTGTDYAEFVPGPAPVLLSAGLARIAVGEGWARAADEQPNVVVFSSPFTGETQTVTLPEARATKVVSPPGTKVEAPEETKAETETEPSSELAALPQKSLLALAKDKFGLTFRGNPSKQAILEAIAQQEGKA